MLRVLVGLLLGVGLVVAALRGGSYALIPRTELSMAITWVAGLSLAFGLLPSVRMSRAQRVAVIALAGLAAWTALGLAWTSSAERTVDEVMRVVSYAALAVLVAWTFRAGDRVRVVALAGAACGLVCVLAIVARLAPEVAQSALAKSGYATQRLDFPFNYWNALGCWAAMSLAVTLALSAHTPRAWERAAWLALATVAPVVAYLTYSRAALLMVAFACVLTVTLSARRWVTAFNAVVAAAGAAVVVLVIRGAPEIARGTGTHGRGSVAIAIALVLASVLAVALAGPYRRLGMLRVPRRVRRRLAAGAAVALLAGAAVAGPVLARDVWRSFQRNDARTAADPAQRLTSLGGNRHDLWPTAIDIFRREPLHGIGAGTFEFAWNVSPRRSSHVVDAHSLYLESLAELGAPGGILVVLALGALLVAGLRAPFRHADGRARGAAAGCAAAFAVFCVSAGVDWMWESTAVACLAIVLGTVAAAGPGLHPPARRGAVRLGGTALAVAALLVALPILVGAAQIHASQEASARGRLVEALADADSAVQVVPWAATAPLQRALVLERLGQLARAELAAAQAVRGEPGNWEHWLILGRIRAERGRLDQALAAVRQARRRNPRSPLFAPGVARRLLGSGG